VAVEFQILGPLEVLDDQARPLALGGAKQRALLAVLLLRAGEVVPAGRLVDELWGEDPPATACHVLQVYVANLRKALEPDRARALGTYLAAGITIEEPITVAALRRLHDQLPARLGDRFEGLVEEGRAMVNEHGLPQALSRFLSLQEPQAENRHLTH
jgi:DNA-binding SARP family transcriptional activator